MGRRSSTLLACATAIGVVLGGCGSQTKTVSVSGSPVSTRTGGRSTGTSEAKSTGPAVSAPAPTTTSPTTTGQSEAEATRTTTAPAFTKQSSGSEGLSGAVAVMKAHGYSPGDTSDYHPGQTLRVLVGTRAGSGDGYGQQAFFFLGGRYLGTDTSEPSASVKVVSQSDTEVTLAYPLYRAHDPLCCPGGGQATVRFQLNDGRLVPLNPIPPANSEKGLSRQ